MIMSVICNLSWHGNFDHENSKKNALSLNPPYKLKLLYFLGRFLFVRITDWPDPANYLARPIKFWIVCMTRKKGSSVKTLGKSPFHFQTDVPPMVPSASSDKWKAPLISTLFCSAHFCIWVWLPKTLKLLHIHCTNG